MIVAALLLTLAAAPPEVCVRLAGTGVDAETAAAVSISVARDVAAAGGRARTIGEGEPSTTCAAVLALDVVRAGPTLRIDQALAGTDGAALGQAARTLRLDELATATVLDRRLAARVTAMAPPPPPPPAAVAAAAPAVADAADDDAAPPLFGIGLAGTIGGVALGALAGGVAIEEALVANAATTSGAEKERARWLGPTAAVVGVGAGLIAIAGAGLIIDGLAREP